MVVIVQTHAGNRYIGEVPDRVALDQPDGLGPAPKANEEFTLLYPLGYLEQPGPNGQVGIGLPPPLLSGPVKEMSIIGTFVIQLNPSNHAQLIAAYEQATQTVKAAITGIVPAGAGALRNLRPVR